MKYSGIDLHSNNSVVVVSDEAERVLVRQRGGIVVGERTQMQRVLHVGREIRGGQRDLRPLLSKDPPARIFVCVPSWPGPFDIEIDCVATR